MTFLLVWLPFILVLFLPLILYTIGGYKKGALGAIIMLFSTILTALIAVILSKLLSGLLSSFVGRFVEFIKNMAGSFGELIDGAFLLTYLGKLFKSLAACIIFIVLFPIVNPFMRLIASWIASAVKTKKKGLKWAGLAIGVVDAMLFAFLMLSPYYAVIGTVGTAIDNLMKNTIVGEEIASRIPSPSALPVKAVSLLFDPSDVLLKEKIGDTEVDFCEDVVELSRVNDLSSVVKAAKNSEAIGKIIDDIVPGGEALPEIIENLKNGEDIVEPVKKLIKSGGENLKKKADTLCKAFNIEDSSIINALSSALEKTEVNEENENNEAEAVATVLEVVYKLGNEVVNSFSDITDNPQKLLGTITKSEVVMNLIDNLDVSKLSGIAENVKEEMMTQINAFISSIAGNPTLTANAEKIRSLISGL